MLCSGLYDWLVQCLVVVDERGEDPEPVTSWRTRPGIHEALDLFERGAMISPGLAPNQHRLLPWWEQ